MPKLKQNTTKPEFWITKHKKMAEDSKKTKLPDIGTYKHHPADYDTFGKRLQLIEDKKLPEKKKNLYWVN
jgi:hypothetical protein